MLQGTVMAWHEALTYGRTWDEGRDAPRFQHAFIRYAAASNHHWPVPADIVALLPPYEEFKALPPKAEDSERSRKLIDDLAQHLGVRGRAH